MDELKLSIIIPVFNTEKYIYDCLESILFQTLSINLFEILIVNDGSTDGSLDLIKKFENVEQIRILNQKNHGLSSARNNGIIHSKGKYIGFVDSDDLVDSKMFESMLNLAELNDADMVACEIQNFAESIQKTDKKINNEINELIVGNDNIFSYFSNKSASACNKIFKRELFDKYKFPYGKVYEDLRTVPKIYLEMDKAVWTSNYYYFHREHQDSITGSFSIEKGLQRIEAFRGIYLLSKERKNCKKWFLSKYYQSIFDFYYSIVITSASPEEIIIHKKMISEIIIFRLLFSKVKIKVKILIFWVKLNSNSFNYIIKKKHIGR